MQQALYHPEFGYYSSGRATIGRRGDYFTNVSVGPLFGRLMAAQFTEMWERLGKVDKFVIVEQGAHDGQFARDVLEALQEISAEFYSALTYRIVESFRVWQDRQSQTLAPFGDKVNWSTELDPFTGVHFSNELLDAMPIHLRHKLVGLNGDAFVFVKGDSGGESAILHWIDDVAAKLQTGFVIAIDYGFVANEFREMIQTRAQHRSLDSPFEEIGDADITAHINWTDIAERAKRSSLQIAGFTDQHHFLTGIISTWPKQLNIASLDSAGLTGRAGKAGETSKPTRALQTLLHPEMMGRAFQVLVLAKDVDLAAPLAGFKFGRDARVALGL